MQVVAFNFVDGFTSGNCLSPSKAGRDIFTQSVIAAIAWHIWKVRCNKIFRNENPDHWLPSPLLMPGSISTLMLFSPGETLPWTISMQKIALFLSLLQCRIKSILTLGLAFISLTLMPKFCLQATIVSKLILQWKQRQRR